MLTNVLAERLKDGSSPVLVDVRSKVEFQNAHIPSAVHVPFWAILFCLQRLPKDRRSAMILMCEHGPRAVLARWQLMLVGYRNLDLLAGHMAEWKRRGLPLKKAD